MTLIIPKNINRDTVERLKHKLHIGYLYFKRYFLWIFLAFFLLLVVNIIVKNTWKTSHPTLSQSSNSSVIKGLVVKVDTEVETVKKETRSVSSSQLKSLKQQLLIEKEKYKNLEKILNIQELQITSALDEISQTFRSFNSDAQESNKISVPTGASNDQTEYYNKVKAALSKISPVNRKEVEKLSTTNDDSNQDSLRNL